MKKFPCPSCWLKFNTVVALTFHHDGENHWCSPGLALTVYLKTVSEALAIYNKTCDEEWADALKEGGP